MRTLRWYAVIYTFIAIAILLLAYPLGGMRFSDDFYFILYAALVGNLFPLSIYIPRPSKKLPLKECCASGQSSRLPQTITLRV